MAEDGKGKGAVIPIGACEAAHVIRVCQGMRNAVDSDLPALALFLQYSSQCEGPLWREIRGNGLPYGANIYESTDAGLIFLSLYRTADPVRALQQTTDIVNKILSGESKLDDAEFEAAKRSLVFKVIDREDTVSSASNESLLSYVRQVLHTYNQDFCKAIWDKSAEEVLAAAKKWLPPLLSADQFTTAITCHPSKLNDIVQGFSKMGQELKQMTLEDAELSNEIQLSLERKIIRNLCYFCYLFLFVWLIVFLCSCWRIYFYYPVLSFRLLKLCLFIISHVMKNAFCESMNGVMKTKRE